MATINSKYFVDDNGEINFYEDCKADGKYAKINPLKIDNYFQLVDLLKHIDDDNIYRPKESELYNKIKLDGSDRLVPVQRTYAFLEHHGCELVGANSTPCYGIIGVAIDIKLTQIKYSKMNLKDVVEFSPILEITKNVYSVFETDCELHCFVSPSYLYQRKSYDKKFVCVEEILNYLKKLNISLLYLIRYYQDIDMLSAYVQVQNMELP